MTLQRWEGTFILGERVYLCLMITAGLTRLRKLYTRKSLLSVILRRQVMGNVSALRLYVLLCRTCARLPLMSLCCTLTLVIRLIRHEHPVIP